MGGSRRGGWARSTRGHGGPRGFALGDTWCAWGVGVDRGQPGSVGSPPEVCAGPASWLETRSGGNLRRAPTYNPIQQQPGTCVAGGSSK